MATVRHNVTRFKLEFQFKRTDFRLFAISNLPHANRLNGLHFHHHVKKDAQLPKAPPIFKSHSTISTKLLRKQLFIKFRIGFFNAIAKSEVFAP